MTYEKTMAFRKLAASAALGLTALCFGRSAPASITIPFGLQSNVSQATLNSWGWTEIHRSTGWTPTSEGAIVAAATGDYLMMGVFNPTTQLYEILGAGATSAVTAITYANWLSDDNGNYNPNFSNGLNFYRTANFGSWGFTTNTVTDLYSADWFLNNGLQATNGNVEGALSKGLSFHTDSGSLTGGWAFNVTGNNWQEVHGSRERVFFTVDSTAEVAPEPGQLVVWSVLGAMSVGGVYLRRRR